MKNEENMNSDEKKTMLFLLALFGIFVLMGLGYIINSLPQEKVDGFSSKWESFQEAFSSKFEESSEPSTIVSNAVESAENEEADSISNEWDCIRNAKKNGEPWDLSGIGTLIFFPVETSGGVYAKVVVSTTGTISPLSYQESAGIVTFKEEDGTEYSLKGRISVYCTSEKKEIVFNCANKKISIFLPCDSIEYDYKLYD